MARMLAGRRAAPVAQASQETPAVVLDSLVGIGLAAGGANVIMQLSRLPVGRGVAESRVESGRVDRHPIKRLRTTSAYLLVAMLGTEDERRALRQQIDRAHAQVHSLPGDPVAYNAFDHDLQLWVAACLYKGVEDVHELYHGVPPDRALVDDILYPYCKRLGTTLQMPEELWPADRDAFEAYWRAGVAHIHMDEVTRAYLRTIADLSFLVAPLGRWGRPLAWVLRPIGHLMTVGFLPPEFREELGLPWDERRQRRFDRATHTAAAVARHLPRPLREFPLNVYWRDTRRRLAEGRPVV
jgi:uncharacterized protein (DUF2236 family)